MKFSLKTFVKRLNVPYRIYLYNVEENKEVGAFYLSKKTVYILFSTLVISIFLLISLLIFFTPLRYYLPGNNTVALRKRIIKLERLSDSLIELNSKREQFIYNIIRISSGSIGEKRDTNLLSTIELNNAKSKNDGKIDQANHYNYLKKETMPKIDTLQQDKND